MSYFILKVCILNRPTLNRLFDYYAKETVEPGQIVEVEFNKSMLKALVIENKETKVIEGIKPISATTEQKVDEEVISLLKMLVKKYFFSYSQAIKILFPKKQLPLNAFNNLLKNSGFQTFYLKESLGSYLEKNSNFLKNYQEVLIVCPDLRSVKQTKLLIKDKNASVIHKNEIGLIYPNVDLIIIREVTNYRYRINKFNPIETLELASFKARFRNIPLILEDREFTVNLYKAFLDKEIKLFNDFEIIDDKPLIHLVEMNQELQKGNISLISENLKRIVADNILQTKRSLLVHPFKGYAHLIACRSCGEVIKCSLCLKVLAYHKENNMMSCSCGFKKEGLDNCLACDNKTFIESYPGLEQFQEELKNHFPKAQIVIADFKEKWKNADIVLTTDIGLSTKDFSLVGLLNFDFYNNLKDFNSKERCFLDLRTVINNLNDKEKQTDLIIQAFNFCNDALEFALNNDFEGFYEEEIANRERTHTSPFRNSLKLEIYGPKREAKALDIFFELQKDKLLRVLRPLSSKVKQKCQVIIINYPPDYPFERQLQGLTEKYSGISFLVERVS